MRIKRALISLSNKTGLESFAKGLMSLGVEIVSTGGTKKFLEENGVKVRDISDFTGFPEILDGRVKTLHPKVHGGLLAKRENASHVDQVKENEIEYIDMVVVNLYPFREMLAKDGVTHEEMIENIDIGGPSMLRSAAKNYEDVVVVCDFNDYDFILDELKNKGDISKEMRLNLAAKVFVETSIYDELISSYMVRKSGLNVPLPDEINIKLAKKFSLRYGENPHQKANYYVEKDKRPHVMWTQLHGKELSYNNLVDIEAAWNLVTDYKDLTVAVIKHTNPCGLAQDDDMLTAYKNALAADPVSAYGGIVAMNKNVTKAVAQEISKIFTECVVAPSFDDDALTVFREKKNLRVMEVKGKEENIFELRRVLGGMLVQDKDCALLSDNELKIVTKRAPSEDELSALKFAWTAVKHVKSNAIVLAKKGQILGVGAGQTSRVDSTEIAVSKAQKIGFDLKGAVMSSDAFFPFRDSIDEIVKHGITAIIQPGGSIRDEEVIAACNEHNIAMIFTGIRHFKH